MRRLSTLSFLQVAARQCSTTTNSTPEAGTSSNASEPTSSNQPLNPDWKAPTGAAKLKATTNIASFIDAETAQYTPITNSLLYRKLLKLYIKKFDTDVETIVKGWKQTKYEFYTNSRRNQPHLTDEDCAALNIRGQQVHMAIQAGVIPIVQNAEGESYARYDADTIRAAHHQIDPVDAEEYLRRHHDRLSVEERDEIRDKLKAIGRWKGPDEFSDKDVSKLKVRRKNLMKTTCGPEGSEATENETTEAETTRVSKPVTVAPQVA
eukprot:GILI01024556.1.p1 GENE.GILI01024556.1~~GILI01024556.1.p1  ORF type:complete len:264 (+),score=68.26 GILI01024556.1:58-849(+)